MRRYSFLLTFLTLAACSSASPKKDADASFPVDPYSSFATDLGTYRVTMRTSPSQPPIRGDLQIELRVTDANGSPVDGLDVRAVPWMPSHGHGSSVEPSIVAEGEGNYRVEDVSMYMPGEWQLRLDIGSDHAAPTVDVQ